MRISRGSANQCCNEYSNYSNIQIFSSEYLYSYSYSLDFQKSNIIWIFEYFTPNIRKIYLKRNFLFETFLWFIINSIPRSYWKSAKVSLKSQVAILPSEILMTNVHVLSLIFLDVWKSLKYSNLFEYFWNSNICSNNFQNSEYIWSILILLIYSIFVFVSKKIFVATLVVSMKNITKCTILLTIFG